MCAELRRLAQAAVPCVERVARERAGQDATARTVAFCGYDGTVAYSMIGTRCASSRYFFGAGDV